MSVFRPVFLILAALLSAVADPGCAHLPMAKDYQGAALLPERMARAFSRDRHHEVQDITLIRNTPDYVQKRVRLSRGRPGSRAVEADLFTPLTRGRKAVILVLPILGGKNTHACRFAAFFAEQRFPSLVVHRAVSFRQGFDCGRVDEMTRNRVGDIRAALDWAQTLPGLGNCPAGILGISLGGMAAAVTAAVDHRIRAAVLMLAGGDLARILTDSREPRIREKRQAFMTAHSLTLERFHDLMARTITYDPLAVAPYTDARNVLLFLALFDWVVPFETGLELRARMGGPETVVLFSGHYTAGIYLNWAREKSLEFFCQKL